MQIQQTPASLPPRGSGGFINQDEIISQLGIKERMVIADLGCGSGYFTIPMARLMGNTGKVYAVDVLTAPLEAVQSQTKLYGLVNVETVRANVEVVGGTKIPDGRADLVVLANILFQCPDRKAVLAEAKRLLAPGGRIAIIDWIPNNTPLGPKFENCVPEEEAKKLAIENGLKAVKELTAGEMHYGFVLETV